MRGMTKPVKVSFISRAGLKVRKPIGKLTKPVKIAFLSNPAIKARDKSVE